MKFRFFFFNELNKPYYLKERPTNVPHIQKYTMDGYKTWLKWKKVIKSLKDINVAFL